MQQNSIISSPAVCIKLPFNFLINTNDCIHNITTSLKKTKCSNIIWYQCHFPRTFDSINISTKYLILLPFSSEITGYQCKFPITLISVSSPPNIGFQILPNISYISIISPKYLTSMSFHPTILYQFHFPKYLICQYYPPPQILNIRVTTSKLWISV